MAAKHNIGSALMDIANLTTLVLVALRADGVLTWAWWLLLSPTIICFALCFMAAVVAVIAENKE